MDRLLLPLRNCVPLIAWQMCINTLLFKENVKIDKMSRLTAGVDRDSCFSTDNYLTLKKHVHNYSVTVKGQLLAAECNCTAQSFWVPPALSQQLLQNSCRTFSDKKWSGPHAYLSSIKLITEFLHLLEQHIDLVRSSTCLNPSGFHMQWQTGKTWNLS